LRRWHRIRLSGGGERRRLLIEIAERWMGREVRHNSFRRRLDDGS